MQKIIVRFIFYTFFILVLFYFYLYNPSENTQMFLPCLIKKTTGLQCASCGSQRAFYELLHGNIKNAISYNILFVVLIPILVLYYFWVVEFFYVKNKNINTPVFSLKVVGILGLILLVFMIVRNSI